MRLDRPTTVSAAVKLCSKAEFPNVHVLLRIACTYLLHRASAKEPSKAACIRYTRSHERQWLRIADRLSSLALIHIHYDMEIDLDEVVTIFSVKEPR